MQEAILVLTSFIFLIIASLVDVEKARRDLKLKFAFFSSISLALIFSILVLINSEVLM